MKKRLSCLLLSLLLMLNTGCGLFFNWMADMGDYEEITIDTNGKNFKTRDNVTITINSKSDMNGNYLISVKQKEEVTIIDKNQISI